MGMTMGLHIITLIDQAHAGDDNNARGVTNALKRSASKNVKISEINVADMDEFLAQRDMTQGQFVFVSAGAHNLPALTKIKKQYPSAKTIWSSHQYTDQLKTARAFLDVAGLPGHVLSEMGSDKKNYLELPGVPHNLQMGTLTKAFNERRQKIPPSPNGYDMVMLAGDAPDENGDVKFYSADEAYAFGRYIAKNASGRHILATNGPRTGKYDPVTGDELMSHRDFHPRTKEPLETALDDVSAAFIRGMTDGGMKQRQDFSFYDFRFKAVGVDSAYHALLAATSDHQGRIYMAGESVSMISEVCDFGKNDNVYVFDNGAMNDGHKNFVRFMHQKGYFHRLDHNLNVSARVQSQNNHGEKPKSAAQLMADATLMTLRPPRANASIYRHKK